MLPISRRLLLITLIESFATSLVELGVYFYAHQQMGFSDTQNLVMAVGFGVAYVVGAFTSHPLAVRWGEKRVFVGCTLGLLALHGVLAVQLGGAATLIALNALVGLATGCKWPIIESYICAGHTPGRTTRAVGLFNLAWSGAVVPALASAGVMIDLWPPMLFLIPAGINVATMAIVRPMAARPTHLAHDHPERPPAGQIQRYRALLVTSRWTLMSSYTLIFVISPLLPGVFDRLGFGVSLATVLGALLHLARFVMFYVLQRRPGWHGRADVLIGSIVGLPVSCALVLFADHVALVLLGEVIFGLSAGMTYHAALYYAMVVRNASVEAGGIHEGLIGIGFVLGPLVGLAGMGLAGWAGSPTLGLLVALTVLVLVCTIGAIRPLAKLRHAG